MTLYDPELEVGSATERQLILVGSERRRQDLLKQQGRFKYVLADPEMDDGERFLCIMEEVGEVARNVLARRGEGFVSDDDKSDAALKKELSQVAALAVAWMEAL